MAGSAAGRELRQKIHDAGAWVDLLDGVERVLLSSTGERRPGDERPPVVIAAEGRFDLSRLRAVALRKLPQTRFHHGVELLEENPGAGAPMAVALVNPQILLLGDAGAVRATLESATAPVPEQTDRSLAARAAQVAAAGDVWLVADSSPSLLASKNAEETALLAAVEGAELSLSFSEGLELAATLATASAENAQKLAGGLQLLLALKMAVRLAAGGTDPTRNLQIFTDGPLVKLALRMNEEELRAAFREAEPAIRAAMALDSRESAEEAPSPRLIRIYGLAEGVREIPLGR